LLVQNSAQKNELLLTKNGQILTYLLLLPKAIKIELVQDNDIKKLPLKQVSFKQMSLEEILFEQMLFE